MNGNKNYGKVERSIKNRTHRKVSIYSIDPYIIFFSVGCAKKEREKQIIAKEVAESFSHPDNQIWIYFNPDQQKWIVKIQANTIKAIVRKIKLIFGKYILPEMMKEYKNCLAKPSTIFFLTLIN